MNWDWLNHAGGLLPALIVLTAKATAAMAPGLFLVRAMRRTSAGARHLVLAGVLTVVLCMPLLTMFLPSLTVAGRWLNPVNVEVRQAVQPRQEPFKESEDSRPFGRALPQEKAGKLSPVQTQEPVAVVVSMSSPSAPPKNAPRLSWGACLAILWLGGIVVALTPLVVSRIALLGLSRRCSRFDDPAWSALLATLSARLNLKRRVGLLAHNDVGMPMTWGIFRPVVLFPAACTGWPENRRRIVLLHELAHVKRLDCLWLLVGKLARAVHWFNPLAWWCVARLRTEAERACDERVLRAGESGPEYAEQLLAIVASLGGRSVSDVLALGMARRSTLEIRLRSILENSRVLRGLTTRRVVAMVVGLAATTLPLSMLRVAAQTPPGPRKVAIQVVSVDGSPRASAYVNEKLSAQNAGTTDPDGRCEITVTDPNVSRWFASWPGSTNCAVFAIPAGRVEQPVVAKLESPLGHSYQRVTDGQGHGVSGVNVTARLMFPDAAANDRRRRLLRLRFDPDDSGVFHPDRRVTREGRREPVVATDENTLTWS